MSNYSYVAVDPQGVESRGTLDVSDQTEALRRIKEMGLFPTRVLAANQAGHRAVPQHTSPPAEPRTRNLSFPPCGGSSGNYPSPSRTGALLPKPWLCAPGSSTGSM